MTLSLDKGLGRLPYLVAGTALFALKIAIDVVLARGYGRPYSILQYISPTDSPLFRPSDDISYWFSMWYVALPFIGIGFTLTIRRLRDAGLSPWLALLFFVPFINLVFFAFCAFVPAGVGRHQHVETLAIMSYERAMLSAGLLGAVVGLSAITMATFLIESYGGALFIGAPFIAGFLSGYLFTQWHRPRFMGAVLAALLALLIAGAVVLLVAFEGLICVLLALPLEIAGALMGAGIGYLLQRAAHGGGITPIATALLLLPVSMTIEGLNPLPAGRAMPVESSIIVDAPADVVWRHVIAFPPLQPPTEWIFHAGVAAPMEAVIHGEGVGAIRHCIFTTGSFIEPIEVWDPPRELRFGVTSTPDPMQEWTLWNGPRPPHLDGYLQSTRGQFLLEPLAGGRTRLVGRTWYRTNMVPDAYWRLWSDPIIHTIHMRVLRHVAGLSEQAARQSMVASKGVTR